jgi:sialic acid synthase SpsE
MNNTYFEIEGRKIGYNFEPLIIAEIGINHGGSLEVAKLMVDAASRAGIEIVKHQTHIVEDEMCKESKNIIPSHTKESIFEIIRSCSLSEEDEFELQKYVKSKNMIFISTPFSRAAADRLQRMRVEAFKIGSGECNNYPLLEYICDFGKPIVLSTGMNTIESVAKAVSIIKNKRIPYALLHTTNVYPTPPEYVRLGAMSELMQNFTDSIIGLSDHTTSNHACLGAIAMGASIVERHFTDNMNRIGPDIICSMDENAAKDLILGAKLLKKMRGGNKGPIDLEKPTIDFAFASVVSIKKIKKGEIFTKDNIWVKRPGTGDILAENFSDILGKMSNTDIEIDEFINWKNVIV